MGSLSDFAELELLDHLCNVAYVSVATVYLALCTADPTDAGTGATIAECADANNYARTAIAFGAAAARTITQNAQVTFPQATGAWGLVTHWAILDGNTHGADDVLAHGAFDVGKNIVNGNTPSVANTEVYVEFSAGEISDACSVLLLDRMFRNQAYAVPDTYVALCTVVVADDDTGATITEHVGDAYAREQVTPNGGAAPTWDVAVAGLVDNTHAIDFTLATGDWGLIVAVAIVDAAANGGLLVYDNAMADQDVDDGDTASFPIGDLDITMS